MDMHYTTIKNPYFLFENLQAEIAFSFKIGAVNKEGKSEWATVQAKTKNNPLEFAINYISSVTSAEDEEGNEINKLFNFYEKDICYIKYGIEAYDIFEVTSQLDGGVNTAETNV